MQQKITNVQRLIMLLALTSMIMIFVSTQLVWSKPRAVTITQWQTTAALPEGLASRTAVTYGDFLYVVGGKLANENPTATIYGARLAANGGVESWAVMGQLPMPLYLHATVVGGDALYVIGGWDGSATRSEVWRAPFLSDGRIGGWTAMPAYPITLDLHDAVFVNGRIYAVGGWDGSQALRRVYAATIQGAGLGPWQLVGDLPQALYRLAIAADAQRLYVTGGYTANEVSSAAVYVAGVNSDGTLTGWQTYSLPVALYYHKAVIHDERLVVLGGRDNTQAYNQVYAAPINGDGTLGGWQNMPALPAAIYRMGAVTVKRDGAQYIFVTGGARSETDFQSAVYHSDAPPPPSTPTPTVTPTMTPSPTPTPGVVLALDSVPHHWLAPGEAVTYVITYQNRSPLSVSNVVINNRIPNAVELVPNSIRASQGVSTTTGTTPGALISWQLGVVNSGVTGQVSYQARRSLPPTPVVPPALTIEGTAPTTADAGQPITYQFIISNQSPATLSNLVITNTLPVGASYVSGGDGPPTNRIVRWSLPMLTADSSTTVQLIVTLQQSAVNSDYRVTTQEGPTARGRTTLITSVNGEVPTYGDGVLIMNTGAQITWISQGQTVTAESRMVYNPSFSLYLPLVRR